MCKLHRLLFLVLLCAALTACAAAPSGGQGAYGGGRRYGGDNTYTKADYDLALSFQLKGYPQMSVAAYNRKVLDWEEEESFHKTQAALERVVYGIQEDDPNKEFLLGTLRNTLSECVFHHYNACKQAGASHWGSASRTSYGDVYGDQVWLRGGDADFSFSYTLTDEAALTVQERDALLDGVRQRMQAFLDKQSEPALKQEAKMQKQLSTQLARELSALDPKRIKAFDGQIYYGWSEMFPESIEQGTAMENSILGQSSYTKAQLDTLLSALQPLGYPDVSIALFNRTVNAVLYEDGTGENSMIYELARMNLPEDHPNYRFLNQTVRQSLDEYQSKLKEAATGKPCDPWAQVYQQSQRMEDVFGDQVPTATAQADYRFSYRILDADSLTPAGRDAFLQAVQAGVQAYLDAQIAAGDLTQAGLEKGIAAAGQVASTEAIRYTGCEIGFFELYH